MEDTAYNSMYVCWRIFGEDGRKKTESKTTCVFTTWTQGFASMKLKLIQACRIYHVLSFKAFSMTLKNLRLVPIAYNWILIIRVSRCC